MGKPRSVVGVAILDIGGNRSREEKTPTRERQKREGASEKKFASRKPLQQPRPSPKKFSIKMAQNGGEFL